MLALEKFTQLVNWILGLLVRHFLRVFISLVIDKGMPLQTGNSHSQKTGAFTPAHISDSRADRLPGGFRFGTIAIDNVQVAE